MLAAAVGMLPSQSGFEKFIFPYLSYSVLFPTFLAQRSGPSPLGLAGFFHQVAGGAWVQPEGCAEDTRWGTAELLSCGARHI